LQGNSQVRSANGRFSPYADFKSLLLVPSKKYRVAVFPFFNLSKRSGAGDLVSLHFLQQLSQRTNWEILEPGVLRKELLRYRLVMNEGLSLADADFIFSQPLADLIVTGTVHEYYEMRGNGMPPRVDFTVSLLERETKRVIWQASSYHTGDDGVLLFDLGKVRTADELTARMAGSMIETMMRSKPLPKGEERN
jgi:hypothetical protein